MTRVEKLEHEIRSLSAQELTRFREWFAAFDAAAWDRQIEEDAKAGRLDSVDSIRDQRRLIDGQSG